ncbi:MAG: ACP S-malonyltransferase [Moraxellaceae bacterium]|jgi:[acyl-carrier-protein] S-malonyltransferase|nr:ACP S-malonyltransferase [Moraxellaceae bacterium]MBK7299930.1 ACP S-malonyltransferase [Moraxellaceae bacterium]MBK9185938.1 ACP S-malonyltransferase [Moraxellaceae bacterium]MBL0229571.1 ACP S-malonyltransferase [Moraxellaceae bacterium]HQV80833.1 ACP S-malonyltransferase [Agitococcus sp.]
MTHLAFVFPGQGSQQLGMLADVAEQYPLIRQTFGEASDALGLDLWQLCQENEAELNKTENTQPVLLTASIALWRVWQAFDGAKPAYLAGHSLGEYSALVAGGVMSLADGVRLVALRGRLMQQAVPAGLGAMAAILGLDDATVIDVCQSVSNVGVVEAVNFNAPAQVVIAGETEAVQAAMKNATERGAKRALILPVSVPAHSSLMRPAAAMLADALENIDFHQAVIPVVQNVTARAEANSTAIRQALVSQLYSPVKWSASVEYLVSQDVIRVIECGTGKVLCGLNKRINKGLTCETLENVASLTTALAIK